MQSQSIRLGELHITAPVLGAMQHSEAEVFGSVAWLWMHALIYRNFPVHALSRSVLPAIKAGQFLLASIKEQEDFKPVAYVTWANLSERAEAIYLEQAATFHAKIIDWNSGDRMWITEWFAPFGHSAKLKQAMAALLPHACARTLDHRTKTRGLRVLHVRGDAVNVSESRLWWARRPLPEWLTKQGAVLLPAQLGDSDLEIPFPF